MLAARIIAREPYGVTNFFTLDVGQAQGVDMGMAVISHMGILGRIVQVSRNYSEVMPYLHSQFNVPVMIDTLGAVGIVSGQTSTPDSLILSNIVKTQNVQIGPAAWSHMTPVRSSHQIFLSERLPPSGRSREVISGRFAFQPAAPLHTSHIAFVVLRHSGQLQTESTAE